MLRVPNWDIALHAWARSVVGQPYVWGETDCGSLVRGALIAMYGTDLLPHVDRYGSMREALTCNQHTGGVEAVLRGIGAVDVPIKFAQQGDVLIETDIAYGFAAACIVVGRDVIFATVEDGVIRTKLRGRSGTLLRVLANA